MPVGAQAIIIALVVMLAIIAGIAAYHIRQYRHASPETRQEMNQTYKRYSAMAGVLLIAGGVFSMTQEDPYLTTWWFGAGCAGIGVLLLIAAWIGIPSWAGQDGPGSV